MAHLHAYGRKSTQHLYTKRENFTSVIKDRSSQDSLKNGLLRTTSL